jgi:uncharacterized protein YndB with AHSA1/START domain
MAEDLGFTITRDYEAKAAQLFAACSRPEYLRRWFGPVGWPITLCEVDFRVGGRWRFAMTGPSGQQNTPFGGRYLDIVPNERIVIDNTFEAPGAETMVMTFGFAEAAGLTRLTHHTQFASAAMKAAHLGGGFEAGTNSAFDQLGDVLRGMA